MTAGRDLRGAVVAVVGATGGIGSAVVEALTARGAIVVATARPGTALDGAVPAGGTALELDIRDPGAGDALVAAATAAHGRLDGVIVASGVSAFGDLVATPDDVIEEVFLIDVLGPMWLARRVAPALTASGGFLVVVSAVLAEQPVPGMAAYGAAKAAASSFTRALARELRRSGVAVVDVRPPHTETGLASRAIHGEPPRLRAGLAPEVVAERLVVAVERGETEVPSDQFGTPA